MDWREKLKKELIGIRNGGLITPVIAFIEELLEEKDFIISALESSEETLEDANEKLAKELNAKIKLPEERKLFNQTKPSGGYFKELEELHFAQGFNQAIDEVRKLNNIK